MSYLKMVLARREELVEELNSLWRDLSTELPSYVSDELEVKADKVASQIRDIDKELKFNHQDE